MSKENAIRFLMAKDKDEGLKSAFNTIMEKYDGKNLPVDEREPMLQEEIISLAKAYGYDFTPEDLKELQKTEAGKLSDEELDGVAGGRGQAVSVSIDEKILSRTTYACEFMPSDQIFRSYFGQSTNGCNYFIQGRGLQGHGCTNCANLQVSTDKLQITLRP